MPNVHVSTRVKLWLELKCWRRDYPSYLTINSDLSNLSSIGSVFEQVKKEPNVVIYNGDLYLSLNNRESEKLQLYSTLDPVNIY